VSIKDKAESERLFRRACLTEAGGVGGNARASLNGFRPHPIFIERGSGAYLEDVDGNSYIDYLASFGPLVLGHRPAPVIDAVVRTLHDMGSMFGMGHRLEIEAAESVTAAVPSWELVRFANTGTEAVLAAIRMARAYTGRTKILRFEGHYHGWADQIHFSHKPDLDIAGDDESPVPVPGTAGIPTELAQSLVVQQWNDAEALKRTFSDHGEDLAAVICEPIMGNCTVVPPEPGYLQLLRELTKRAGVVLIFDEVKSGFRVALGGAQELYGVVPDLSTAAKAIAAGFPLAAVGGRRELFEPVIEGRVFHSATYHTNPLSMAACVATMKELRRPGIFRELTERGTELQRGLTEAARSAGIAAFGRGVGPLFQLVFADHAGTNYRDIARSIRADTYRAFWRAMLDADVLFNPQPLECWFVSAAHGDRELALTLEAAHAAFEGLAKASIDERMAQQAVV
jgi:glutamate-1-semialdehyde 2,1-aminomutase